MQEHPLLTALLALSDFNEVHSLLTQQQFQAWIDIVPGWRETAVQQVFAGQTGEALRIADHIFRLGERLADAALIAQAHWTYGNIYALTNQAAAAIAHFEQAQAHYRASADSLNLARMSLGLVWSLNLAGQFQQALDLAHESRPILHASSLSADQRRLAGLYNNIGIVCKNLGRYEEAIESYQQKIRLLTSLHDDRESQIEEARTYINMGTLEKRVNLWSEAQRHLEMGRATLRRLAPDGYHLDVARAEMHLADVLAALNAPPEQVAAAFERARATAGQSSRLLSLELLEAEWQLSLPTPPPDFPQMLQRLRHKVTPSLAQDQAARVDLLCARHAARAQRREEAIGCFQRALSLAQAVNDWRVIYQVWHGLGKLYEAEEGYDAAENAYQLAIEAIEHIHREISDSDLRSSYLDDKLSVYRDLTHLYLRHKRDEQAFHWCERARARELVDWLRHHDPTLETSAPLETTTSESSEAASRSGPVRLPAHLRQPQRVVTLDALRDGLPPDTLMLIYTLAGDQVWVIPIAADTCLPPHCLGPIPNPNQIEQDLTWIEGLRRYPRPFIQTHAQPLIAAAQRPLTHWYEQFLAPLTPCLDHYGHLIFALDGPLLRLPFHAFYNARQQRYLIETHAVSFTPNATAWHLKTQQHFPGQGGLVVGYAGANLHHTHTEIAAITAAYPDFVVYTDEAARADRLKQVAGQYAYLHLAAHAIFRQDNPLFSFIELADRPLEAAEITRLRLQARLVVLSACETGRGRPRGGEYIGLARAFLLAGAGALVVSHWPVDDQATAEVMGLFYQRLAETGAIGPSLRAAQRAFIEGPQPAYRHPFYWASFYLLGAETPPHRAAWPNGAA